MKRGGNKATAGEGRAGEGRGGAGLLGLGHGEGQRPQQRVGPADCQSRLSPRTGGKTSRAAGEAGRRRRPARPFLMGHTQQTAGPRTPVYLHLAQTRNNWPTGAPTFPGEGEGKPQLGDASQPPC